MDVDYHVRGAHALLNGPDLSQNQVITFVSCFFFWGLLNLSNINVLVRKKNVKREDDYEQEVTLKLLSRRAISLIW